MFTDDGQGRTLHTGAYLLFAGFALGAAIAGGLLTAGALSTLITDKMVNLQMVASAGSLGLAYLAICAMLLRTMRRYRVAFVSDGLSDFDDDGWPSPSDTNDGPPSNFMNALGGPWKM